MRGRAFGWSAPLADESRAPRVRATPAHHRPAAAPRPSPARCSTRWFTPQAVVTRLALTDVKALKPMREPMLLRAQTNDRAVFTFDLEAGALLWRAGGG